MIQEADEQRHVADPETLVADVLDLRALCLVVDLRSLTGAARAMGETKGTISRRITRLEKSLGVALVRRSPRLVEATDDGVAYRMHVGRVLELLGDANLAVRRARATPSGHLRLTAPTDLAIAILAAPITAFANAYPDVRVDMIINDKILDFDTEHLDVALRASGRLPDTQLIAHKLLDLELVAVASPSYLRGHAPPERVEDLAAHRVLYLGTTRGRQKITMHRAGAPREVAEVEVRPTIGASDFSFVKEAALAGGGIAVLPSVLVTTELESGRLVRLLGTHVMSGTALHLVHRGGRFLPPKVRAFTDFMLKAFGVRGESEDGASALRAGTPRSDGEAGSQRGPRSTPDD